MYCLDTNIISYILQNKFGVANYFFRQDLSKISTTIINEMEILYGSENSSNPALNLKNYGEFLSSIKIYNLDHQSAKIYAKIKTKLKKSGQIVDDFDLIIASICLSQNLILVTNNKKHFKNIPNLQIENWVN